MGYPHVPVMLQECLEFYRPLHLKNFFDATLGMGGHAEKLLAGHEEIERYLGCDQDDDALEIAKKRLFRWKDKVRLKRGDFSWLDQYQTEEGIPCFDGILFDVGISSMQLDRKERGFSFRFEAPLDMRMDQLQNLTAQKVVNEYSEKELGRIFREFGEERFWKKIAKKIVEMRKKQKITTTKQLAQIVERIVARRGKLHPATRIFQALRICVNDELNRLEKALQKAISSLCIGGRIVVISFHSLEDRIVKILFQKYSRGKNPFLHLVTKKPIRPTFQEIKKNPRSRSAIMRCAEKIQVGEAL